MKGSSNDLPVDRSLQTDEEIAESSNHDQDHMPSYSEKLLREGLLDLARKDASNEGDGQRIFNLWKFDFLSFVATRHTVYSGLSFHFISQLKFLLSERKSAQLLINRTINLHGGDGRNIPIDYAIELLNEEVKPDLKHKYGNLTTKTIERVFRSIKACKEVEKSIDIQTGKFSAIGRHKDQFFEEDVASMVDELKEEKLFEQIRDATTPVSRT
eukprot:Seg4989.1 transcript_id=Seg4989.1/GoldUCD/mRNA.D3Y31 product="hypothetical protein" protein_id=Seg4989.1/GoldUCD/D3Y31